LLSKSLELVLLEQDPLRVFVSVQFHRRFESEKRRQLFIRTHNKAADVFALCGSNPKLSAFVTNEK